MIVTRFLQTPRPIRSALFLSLLLSSLIGIAGCSQQSGAGKSKRLRIVATTSIVADLVRNVGGDHVQVDTLMPPGVDPHRYTALPGDTVKLRNADLVFYNGLHLEGKLVDVLEASNRPNRPAIAVTASLNPEKDLRRAEAGNDGPHDPHVWFDVRLWAKCIDPVREALSQADPDHAAEFAAFAESYRRQLLDLDQEVRTTVAKLSGDQRTLVTSHDAFGYFAAAYGFEVRGLQGVSTASEPGIDDRRQLAQYLAAKKVKAVFGETSVPTKGLQSVIDSVKSTTGITVTLIGGDSALYSDALGEAGTPGETYIGMVRHNVRTIVKALDP